MPYNCLDDYLRSLRRFPVGAYVDREPGESQEIRWRDTSTDTEWNWDSEEAAQCGIPKEDEGAIMERQMTGDELRQKKNEIGVTIQELAERLDVSIATISNEMSRGAREIQSGKLLFALRTKPEALKSDLNPPERPSGGYKGEGITRAQGDQIIRLLQTLVKNTARLR